VTPQRPGTGLTIIAQWIAGVFLFAATAAVVWWQNSRLTVLYDLSGVLEPATRIAQGDLPYRDFPFPYAPLTFLIQAAIIKLTGAIYWHHIVYACIVAGVSTVLTWLILNLLFEDHLPAPRVTALVLAIPAVILGVYCIFPHPFYDPDAALFLLLSIWLLLRLERNNFPPVRTFLAGVILVVPLFIKQNIGIAWLGSISLWLLIMIIVNAWKKLAIRPYLLLGGGVVAGLLVALVIIHLTVGLDNYKQWTITYATARRSPSLAEMLSVYADWMLVLWAALFFAGAYLVRKYQDRWTNWLGVAMMAAPFIWPVVYLLIDTDASERAERLVGLWPLMFIVAFGLAYIFIRGLSGVAAALPFIIICTAHGAFLSQQLWGSTYGIWPLLIVLIGLTLRLLHDRDDDEAGTAIPVLAFVVSACLCVAGGSYVYSNERLDYVNFEDGDMAHSSLPQLQGMSMRGDFIPDFEELVAYTDREIPRDDGILLLPGEDLFFYTTGRHPHFPVQLFDVTNNPYSPDEIRERVLASDIDWLIVKNDLQIEADDMIDSKKKILEVLKPDFRSVESLNNYEIFKRRKPGDPTDDEDSDDNDDSDSDSDNQ
jgi:hypothetical protein